MQDAHRGFQIAILAGIPVRARASALLAFGLLFWVLSSFYFPGVLPDERGETLWSVAFLATLFLFISTLAHELGHSLVARARGLPVSSITFVMFGGSSDIGTDDQRPSDECLIAISGPAVSILVTGLALAARWGVPNPSQPLAIFLESLILLNLWLGIFNLLPTLPLDGGRLIRGLLWQRSGDYQWATRIAALIGRGLAFTIFGAGLALFIASLDGARSQVPSIAGVDPRSIAIVAMLVGWLLNWGARTAQRQVMLQGRFSGVLVSQLMVSDPPRVHPWTPLTEVVEQEFLQRGERGVAVVREDDALVGLVAYRDARKIPTSDWPNRAAGEVMTPVAELITVTPEDNAEVAIRHMAQRHFNQIPVVAEGRLVGMISRGDVLRFVEATGGRRPL